MCDYLLVRPQAASQALRKGDTGEGLEGENQRAEGQVQNGETGWEARSHQWVGQVGQEGQEGQEASRKTKEAAGTITSSGPNNNGKEAGHKFPF